jgi:hypothetical protein
LGGDASFFHRKQFKIPGKSNENPPQVSSIGSSSKFLANQMKIPPLSVFFLTKGSPPTLFKANVQVPLPENQQAPPLCLDKENV